MSKVAVEEALERMVIPSLSANSKQLASLEQSVGGLSLALDSGLSKVAVSSSSDFGKVVSMLERVVNSLGETNSAINTMNATMIAGFRNMNATMVAGFRDVKEAVNTGFRNSNEERTKDFISLRLVMKKGLGRAAIAMDYGFARVTEAVKNVETKVGRVVEMSQRQVEVEQAVDGGVREVTAAIVAAESTVKAGTRSIGDKLDRMDRDYREIAARALER